MRVQIIGMGIVGSNVANNIIVGFFDVKELHIIDIDEQRLRGQYRDLSDAKRLLGRDLKIIPKIKPENDADVHIICVGERYYEKDMKELLPENYYLVENIIKPLNGKKVIVTNPADYITECLTKKGYDVIEAGADLDNIRENMGYDGKDIRLDKGHTCYGISAEILNFLRKTNIKVIAG